MDAKIPFAVKAAERGRRPREWSGAEWPWREVLAYVSRCARQLPGAIPARLASCRLMARSSCRLRQLDDSAMIAHYLAIAWHFRFPLDQESGERSVIYQ